MVAVLAAVMMVVETDGSAEAKNIRLIRQFR